MLTLKALHEHFPCSNNSYSMLYRRSKSMNSHISYHRNKENSIVGYSYSNYRQTDKEIKL